MAGKEAVPAPACTAMPCVMAHFFPFSWRPFFFFLPPRFFFSGLVACLRHSALHICLWPPFSFVQSARWHSLEQ